MHNQILSRLLAASERPASLELARKRLGKRVIFLHYATKIGEQEIEPLPVDGNVDAILAGIQGKLIGLGRTSRAVLELYMMAHRVARTIPDEYERYISELLRVSNSYEEGDELSEGDAIWELSLDGFRQVITQRNRRRSNERLRVPGLSLGKFRAQVKHVRSAISTQESLEWDPQQLSRSLFALTTHAQLESASMLVARAQLSVAPRIARRTLNGAIRRVAR